MHSLKNRVRVGAIASALCLAVVAPIALVAPAQAQVQSKSQAQVQSKSQAQSKSNSSTRVATTSVTPFTKRVVTVGKSRNGRAIKATRIGRSDAPNVMLVMGQMHGDEPRGRSVVAKLRKLKIPVSSKVQIWTISTMNPDGAVRKTRANSRGVDLNRNFPTNWRKTGKGLYYSGPSKGSERETKAVVSFISKLKPKAVLSFHQHGNTVFSVCDARSRSWVRRTGAVMKLPVPSIKNANCAADKRMYRGTFNEWFTGKIKTGVFATVELPTSRVVTTSRVNRYAKATLKLAREMHKFAR